MAETTPTLDLKAKFGAYDFKLKSVDVSRVDQNELLEAILNLIDLTSEDDD